MQLTNEPFDLHRLTVSAVAIAAVEIGVQNESKLTVI